MFASLAHSTEEDYFANINYSKSIECIMPTAELLINFRINGINARKTCFVYAEKMDFKGLIQLRLTEKCDQRRMYITTVDTASFHELKQDQSLHVTFAGFIENLIRLLQDCQAGKLEINLVQKTACAITEPARNLESSNIRYMTAGDDYQLQFVEMRTFKNLIHLCLPCRMAPLNVVLFYMNSILDAMQKKLAVHEQTQQQLENQVHTHLRRIEQLDAENIKIRENVVENAKSLNERHAQEMQQMQESLRKASEQRHNDNERNRKTINTLQIQIDKLTMERTNLQKEKSQELKRSELLSEELASSKTHSISLQEQNEKLHADLATQKNNERKNEMHLSDARKHVVELQEKLKKYDKNKADIIAELEAEKKILQTKRQALEMATEEISKANEIILKQSQELIKLKKTISWRTEVALEQEKAINEKDVLLKLREEEILHMRTLNDKLRKEIPIQLEEMRKFADALENKYSEQIKALREKLKSTDKENYAPNSGQTARRRNY